MLILTDVLCDVDSALAVDCTQTCTYWDPCNTDTGKETQHCTTDVQANNGGLACEAPTRNCKCEETPERLPSDNMLSFCLTVAFTLVFSLVHIHL